MPSNALAEAVESFSLHSTFASHLGTLEIAPMRGGQVGLVEPRAPGCGQVTERAHAAQTLELVEVVLGLRAVWPGTDDIDPITAFRASNLRHSRL